MNNPTVSNILDKLKPTDIWGFAIYIVIVLCLITLFMQKENSPFLITLLLAGGVMAALMEKIQVFALNNCVVMMVFPLIVVGMTKTPKSRGFALGAALIAGLYLFGRWATLPH